MALGSAIPLFLGMAGENTVISAVGSVRQSTIQTKVQRLNESDTFNENDQIVYFTKR